MPRPRHPNLNTMAITTRRLLLLISLSLLSLPCHSAEYDRDDWGSFRKATRQAVLQRDSVGMVIDYYTGWPIPQEACQLDHVVPVAVAHRLGGYSWPYALRHEFFNDVNNLVCTTGGTNASKSDKTPLEWMPKVTGYLDKWRATCGKYGLNCNGVMP